MDGNEPKKITAAELAAMRSKTVNLPCGLEVKVQILTPFAMLGLGPLPRLEGVPQGSERQNALARYYLRAAIVSPREFPVELYTQDEIDLLVDAIMDLGKLNRGEVVDPTVPLADTASPPAPPESSTESPSGTE